MTEVVADDVILLGGRGGEGGEDSGRGAPVSMPRGHRARLLRLSQWTKGSPTTTFRF